MRWQRTFVDNLKFSSFLCHAVTVTIPKAHAHSQQDDASTLLQLVISSILYHPLLLICICIHTILIQSLDDIPYNVKMDERRLP